MARISKTSLTIKPGYDPKVILAKMIEAKEDKRIVATLFGAAHDFVQRQNQADPEHPFVGLAGQFEFSPIDPSWDTYESGILFLPDSLMNRIGPALDKALYPPPVNADGTPVLKDGKPVENDRRKKEKTFVRFAMEVAIAQAKNPAGFTWEFEWLQQAEEADPFADMRKAMQAQKAMPKPEAVKAVPAPEKKRA